MPDANLEAPPAPPNPGQGAPAAAGGTSAAGAPAAGDGALGGGAPAGGGPLTVSVDTGGSALSNTHPLTQQPLLVDGLIAVGLSVAIWFVTNGMLRNSGSQSGSVVGAYNNALMLLIVVVTLSLALLVVPHFGPTGQGLVAAWMGAWLWLLLLTGVAGALMAFGRCQPPLPAPKN